MGKILLRGFLGLAPIAITLALIVWLYNHIEGAFGPPLRELLGPNYYFPGIGVIAAIIILFVVGLILNNWMVQSFYNWMERMLKKIPLLKTIYTAVNDLMSFFQAGQTQEKGKVVIVDWHGCKMVGLITRENFDDMPQGVGGPDELAVFFPFSYQLGGFTVIIPKSKVQVVDFSVERGLRWSITAGSPSEGKSTYTAKKKRRSPKN